MKTKKQTKLDQGLLKGLKQAVACEQSKISLRTTTMEIPQPPPDFSKAQVKDVRENILKVKNLKK